MSSSTTGERPTEGGQRLTHRWPPISGLAWNICILFSANDAYMRELARTVSGPHHDGCAADRDGHGPEDGHDDTVPRPRFRSA
jgi:hypothetical protein